MDRVMAHLVVRETGDSKFNGMATALVVLFVLIIVTLLSLTGLFFYIRHRRRVRREQTLPLYGEKAVSARSNHRRGSERPTETIFVYQEKQSLLAESPVLRSASPVPEIRITFPEEADEAGMQQAGRVVVVRVGETSSVGLGPVTEKLPSYQQNEGDRFVSLDLDRIGGLTEKAAQPRWQ